MTVPVCEVANAIKDLAETIACGRLTVPRCRRRAEVLLRLLEDVSWGRGGPEHYQAMLALAQELIDTSTDEACRQTGQKMLQVLGDHREVFLSHIETSICPTGECVRLAPAPCQTACPAGIDIPSYVTLIGMGRDAEAIALIREDNPFPVGLRAGLYQSLRTDVRPGTAR